MNCKTQVTYDEFIFRTTLICLSPPKVSAYKYCGSCQVTFKSIPVVLSILKSRKVEFKKLKSIVAEDCQHRYENISQFLRIKKSDFRKTTTGVILEVEPKDSHQIDGD